MWLSPFICTPEAIRRLSDTANEELYSAGMAHVNLTKLAGTPQSVYSLGGRLIGSKSGWLLLEVPNALVRGAFDALHEPGAELPPDFDAHISVMRKEEVEQIGGLDKVTERGHFFKYQLGPIQTVNPVGWAEYTKCWFIKVRSPELEKLRKSYGLSARPKENEHDFHITVAVRKKTVLQENEVSKAATVEQSNWMDQLKEDGTIEQPSKEKVIYIVRHGKTELNSGDPHEDRIRGWKDVPLNKEGKKEAKRLGKLLKDANPTHIYCSNLSRTEDTAKEIAKCCGNEHVIGTMSARPWNVGKYQGQISADVHPILAEYAKKKPDEVLSGGESFNQFRDRYLKLLKKCMTAVDEGKAGPIIIVCHFRNCKLTQAWIKDGCKDDNSINEEVFLRNDLPTGAVIKLTKSGDNGWKCELEADVAEKSEVKTSSDSVGFVSGPSLAPEAIEPDEDSQPIVDRPDDVSGTDDPSELPVENSPKGMGRGTTKWAIDLITKTVVGRYGLTKQAHDEGHDNYIGHYKPKVKVKVDAFSYLPPKGDKDKFAQCETCRAWTGPNHNTCVILGKEKVTADMACNFYQHGNPSPSGAGKEHRVLTPKQAGLVKRQVRCENCAFFDSDGSYCELFEKLNEEYPDVFDLEKNVEAKGCCNFQVPKGEKIEEEAKEAALWYLNDELSKEKEASAGRISLTVIDTKKEEIAEKIADWTDTAKRIGIGVAGVGLGLGGVAMLHQGWKKPGMSFLDMGHRLWTEPENHEHLTKNLGDDSSAANMISMATNRPNIFRQILAGQPVPGVDPELQDRVRELTFGQQKEHMKSMPGDIMVSGTNKGPLGHLQPFMTGSSMMHADVGGLRGGNWLGLWSRYTNTPTSTKPYFKDDPTVRVTPWNVSSQDRYKVGLRPHEDATRAIDRGKLQEWLTKSEHTFGDKQLADLALNELLPELSTGNGHRLGIVSRLVTGSSTVKNIFARTKMPKAYTELVNKGYTTDQAAETCSSFAAKTIQRFRPKLIPGSHSQYSPAGLARLAESGGPYKVHQIELPRDLMSPAELESEHRRIKWGPLLWRAPIAASLLGAGGYMAQQALKTAAQHNLKAVKIKRRDKDVLICPHCGKEVEDKDLYRDAKGWTFHRPCFSKGKGAIKLSASPDNAAAIKLRDIAATLLSKRAFSGGLGSNPVGGVSSVTDPPRPTELDGSTQAAKTSIGGGLFGEMAGTSETQQPLDDTGVSYRTRSSLVDAPAYQESSSVGAQGRMHSGNNSPGAGQEYGSSSGGAAMSAPQVSGEESTDDLGDVRIGTGSSTPSYGQIPHLNA